MDAGKRVPFFASFRCNSLGTRLWLVLLVMVCAVATGCAFTQTKLIEGAANVVSFGAPDAVEVNVVRQSKGKALAQRFFSSIPQPSERTQLLLRRYDLQQRYQDDPDEVMKWLQQLAHSRPALEEIHGLAEIAEIHATWSAQNNDHDRAAKLYATAIAHAYLFLFDPKLNLARNAYDPQFRSICDVYNRSLEGMLRVVCGTDRLKPGHAVAVGSPEQGIDFEVRIEGRWSNQEFERFELVNDYQASGIDNQYHTYGLGVPLIAVRKQQPIHRAFEKYYPPEIALPMTAFMHLLPDDQSPSQTQGRRRAVLTLYDPLEKTQVTAGSTVVPLESDITTPLAYGLRDPLLSKGVLATASLISPNYAPESFGMFMLEPYDPNKIPVVMIHGFWSSPATWVYMFNDLRANREIFENYQFWFYSYPTGQPFWITAQELRRDLAEIRQEVDPQGTSKPMDQMVLVGHSMGGLVSLMQTIHSGSRFWDAISDAAIDSFQGNSAAIDLLRKTFFFTPNHSIDRIITIATPLQGSDFANVATRFVGKKLITLPAVVTNDLEQLIEQNPGKLKNDKFITDATSIDSLATDNPLLRIINGMSGTQVAKIHNIIGRLPKKQFLASSKQPQAFTGDGIVSIESARNPNALSQVYVQSEHSEVHQHHGTIYEVQRVLLEHLAEKDRIRVREIPQLPTVQQAWHAEAGATQQR